MSDKDLLTTDASSRTDVELLQSIDWADEVIHTLTEQIKDIRTRQNAYKAEFRRRCTEAYWEANPHRQRVAEGDLIADHPLWNKGRITHRNQLHYIDPYQRLCTVLTFSREDSQPRSVFGVPLEVVSQARREYIEVNP